MHFFWRPGLSQTCAYSYLNYSEMHLTCGYSCYLNYGISIAVPDIVEDLVRALVATIGLSNISNVR